MRRYALIVGLLLCAIPARANITDTGVGCAVAGTGTTCGSSGVLTVAVGDFIYGFAYKSSTTAPTLPAAFTQIATASASSSSMRSGCAVATSTSFTVSGWTSATDLVVEVYRGTAATTTATCVTAGIGFKTTGGTSGTTSTITYTGGTLTNINGTSWIVSASGSSAHTCTPSNQTVKQTVTGPVAVENDTNAGVTSYSTTTCTGTTGNWKSDTFELLSGFPYCANGICLVQQAKATTSASGNTVASTVTGTTLGNLIITVCGTQGAGAVTGVADNASGGSPTYTLATNSTATVSTFIIGTYSATAKSGATTVTCTFTNTGTNFRAIWTQEVSGFTTPILDVANNITGTTGATDTGAAVTTTGSVDYVAGGILGNSITANPAAGNEFTFSGPGAANIQSGNAFATLNTTSNTSHTPTWTDSGSFSYAATTAAFKSTPAAGSAYMPPAIY